MPKVLPKKHSYYVDIVGTCNLRCPSCPTGNFAKADFSEQQKPLGFMSLEKFDAILAKIAAERDGAITGVHLYNWGEPLLHPKISEIIGRFAAYPNLHCRISSNLSLKVDLNSVIAARPAWMRISLSGFSQDSYSKTHRRGDIELVKSNMRLLRQAIDSQKSTTKVDVCYHVYQHNAGDDFEAMARLSEELGFNFKPLWASFYPVEKIMPYSEGIVTPADAETISMLAIKPEELLAAAQPYRHEPCLLQEGQTAINFDGSVQLCCATYDPSLKVAPDYLSARQEDMVERKRAHSTCDKCIAGGFHAMMRYQGVEAVDHLGNARIAQDGARFRLVAGALVRDSDPSL